MYQNTTNHDGSVSGSHIKRLADNAFIPFYADNTDYQRFLRDVEDGAELLDAEGNVIDGPAFVATLKVIKTIP